MPLLSLEEVSMELSIPVHLILTAIDRNLITPYGGRARLGEPQFSRKSLSLIQEKVACLQGE